LTSQVTISRYEVVGEIGRGSMGIVHRAHDPLMDRDVAIKTVLLPNGLSPAEQREFHERFLREARAAGQLSHPNIVTVYDFNDSPPDGPPFIAMEYVQGSTLHELIDREGALNAEWALEVIDALADALRSAHDAGIVHRDLKPANILIRESDGSAKIVDFGIARIRLSELTHPGTAYGSPSYMSPEHIKGERADARSDLFSLAVILYETLTGHRPFDGDSFTAICYAIVHHEPAPIGSFDSGLGPAFDRFFARALAKDPAARFQDGAAFRSALRALKQEQTSFKAGAATMVLSVGPEAGGAPAVARRQSAPAGPRARDRGAAADWSDGPSDVPHPTALSMPGAAVPWGATPAWAVARRWAAEGRRLWAQVAGRVSLLRLVLGAAAFLLITIGFVAGRGLRGAPDPERAEPTAPRVAIRAGSRATPARTAAALPRIDRAPAAGPGAERGTPDAGGRAADPVSVAGEKARTPAPSSTPAPAEPTSARSRAAVVPRTQVAAAEREPKPADSTVNLPERAVPAPSAAVEDGGSEAAPFAPAAAAPDQQQVAAAADVAYIVVTVKNNFKEGSLTLLVDGEPAYTADLASESPKWNRVLKKATMQADQTLQEQLEIPAGEHTLEAHVVNTANSREHDEGLTVRLEPGEVRTLRIVTGSAFGRKLSLKLD